MVKTLPVVVILVAVAACTAGCTGISSDPTTNPAIDWTQPAISLTAHDMTLTVDNVVFHGATTPDELKPSAQGDEIDVTWTEAGYTQRIHMHFATDGQVWYIDDVRARTLDNLNWYEKSGLRLYSTLANHVLEGHLSFSIDAPHVDLEFDDARLAPLGIQ